MSHWRLIGVAEFASGIETNCWDSLDGPWNANRFGGDTLTTIARLPSRRGSDLLERRRSNAGFLTLMIRDGPRRDYIHLAHFVRGHREIGARLADRKGKPIASPSPSRSEPDILKEVSVEFFLDATNVWKMNEILASKIFAKYFSLELIFTDYFYLKNYLKLINLNFSIYHYSKSI